MDDKFRNVDYSEVAPDKGTQSLIDVYVGYNPWLLISAYSPDNHNDIGLSVEAGGGLTIDLIEILLEKTLIALRQGRDGNTEGETNA